jgi:hypothetical protein
MAQDAIDEALERRHRIPKTFRVGTGSEPIQSAADLILAAREARGGR